MAEGGVKSGSDGSVAGAEEKKRVVSVEEKGGRCVGEEGEEYRESWCWCGGGEESC